MSFEIKVKNFPNSDRNTLCGLRQRAIGSRDFGLTKNHVTESHNDWLLTNRIPDCRRRSIVDCILRQSFLTNQQFISYNHCTDPLPLKQILLSIHCKNHRLWCSTIGRCCLFSLLTKMVETKCNSGFLLWTYAKMRKWNSTPPIGQLSYRHFTVCITHGYALPWSYAQTKVNSQSDKTASYINPIKDKNNPAQGVLLLLNAY